jgi:hypothetical protein
MDEQHYQDWWLLHRRVVTGETLSPDEQRDYEAGREELEAEEWAQLRPARAELHAMQLRLRKLTSYNQQLAQQEDVLRREAAALEERYATLTGETLGLVV